jgi:hypothetical protein
MAPPPPPPCGCNVDRCVGGFITQHVEFAVCRCEAEPGEDVGGERDGQEELYIIRGEVAFITYSHPSQSMIF